MLRAHRKAVGETGLTPESLAHELGIALPTLSNNLRALELPDAVLKHVESGYLHVNVGRKFLVLQNAGHCHEHEMAAIVSAIANNYRVAHRGALPDWNRKNVMQEISERVASNKQNLRPWDGSRLACPAWPAPPERPRSTARPSPRNDWTRSTPSPPATSRGFGPGTSGSRAEGRPWPVGRITNRPRYPEL